MDELVITIPIAPVTKKNHQRILQNAKGRSFIAPSKQYADYERAAKYYCRPRPKIDFQVNVKCLFYMPTRRRVDLTNLLESIDDVLVKAEVLEDDNCRIIESHDGSRVLYDKENPRTEVYITDSSKKEK